MLKVTLLLFLIAALVQVLGACAALDEAGNAAAPSGPAVPVGEERKPASSLPYRLYEPPAAAHADPATSSSERFPLVLFLHGAGERGVDNQAQLRHGTGPFLSAAGQAQRPCFFALPQCPPDVWWNEDAPMQALDQLVSDLIQAFAVDLDRIYITGLSMGGYGTWQAILDRPERYAAALPICGASDPGRASLLIQLPIWAFHGAADGVVNVQHSREMIAAIRQAGGQPLYDEYAEVGHDSWTQTYANEDVLDWLFAQRRSAQGRP